MNLLNQMLQNCIRLYHTCKMKYKITWQPGVLKILFHSICQKLKKLLALYQCAFPHSLYLLCFILNYCFSNILRVYIYFFLIHLKNYCLSFHSKTTVNRRQKFLCKRLRESLALRLVKLVFCNCRNGKSQQSLIQ